MVGLDAELRVLVAVHLDQRALPGATTAARRASRVLGEHLGEGADPWASQAASGSSGSSSGPSAQGGGARRLQADDRDAGGEPRLDRPQAPRSTRRAAATWPVVVQVSPQQTVRGQLDGVTEGFEHRDGVGGDVGSKWLVKVSGQSTGASPVAPNAAFAALDAPNAAFCCVGRRG